MNNIEIKKTSEKDYDRILEVELTAFNGSKKLKNLLTDLLEDPTAEPQVSLLALDGDKPVGHILFSKARIRPRPGFCNLKSNASIMGPVAVIPDYRHRGIGKALIRKGIDELKTLGVDRCFTLGHSHFRPGFGFRPDAEGAGFPAPFPLTDDDRRAWMWLDVSGKPIGETGKVICANAIMRGTYWKIRKHDG
jgi:predicted N-acetyltransferase YhbS